MLRTFVSGIALGFVVSCTLSDQQPAKDKNDGGAAGSDSKSDAMAGNSGRAGNAASTAGSSTRGD